MFLKATLTATVILSLLPSLAMAQGFPRWTVGALGLASTSPFEAEPGSPGREKEVDFVGFPYIAYRGDKFFLEGTAAGARMAGGPTSQSPVTADVLVSVRTRPGSSRDKVRADAGVRLGYASGLGDFELTYLHDVTGASDGSEFTASYSYGIERGRWSITPGISLVRQSGGMAGWLWGVTQAEHERMVTRQTTVLPVYELSDSIINLEASLVATYQLGGGWSVLGFTNLTRLDKDIRRNPGVDEDFMGSFALGVVYSF